MNRHDLPGIDDLFREQDRLAKKLSQEEMNALRRYLKRTVYAECESVIARMRYLQAAHDASERQFQTALDSLQKDLMREQSIASEFKRELGSLAKVFQAREKRYSDQHETMVQEVLKCRETVRETTKAKETAEAEVIKMETELNKHKDMVVDLEDELAKHNDCSKVREDASRLGKELLKAKVDLETLRKALVDAEAKLRVTDYKTKKPLQLRKVSDPVVTGGPGLHFTPKNGPVTFTPSSPYCTSNSCRARQDLEDCRQQFIKKCEEVAYLRCLLSLQKEKSKEQPPSFRKRNETTENTPVLARRRNGVGDVKAHLKVKSQTGVTSKTVTFKQALCQVKPGAVVLATTNETTKKTDSLR